MFAEQMETIIRNGRQMDDLRRSKRDLETENDTLRQELFDVTSRLENLERSFVLENKVAFL